jgi:hypothetical protein
MVEFGVLIVGVCFTFELALNNNHSLTQEHVRAVSYVLKGLYFS